MRAGSDLPDSHIWSVDVGFWDAAEFCSIHSQPRTFESYKFVRLPDLRAIIRVRFMNGRITVSLSIPIERSAHNAGLTCNLER